MADHKREQILDNIISNNIANITTANGYNNNLTSSDYTSAYKVVSQCPVKPFVCLLPGPADYTALTNLEYTSGDSQLKLDGWLISVIAYIEKSTDEQLKSDMENMNADLIKAMETDPKLGLSSFVRNTTLKRILTYPDWIKNVGMIQQLYAVKYDFTRTSP